MGMTMTQKILAKHAHRDSVSAGDLLVSQVDLVLANDITGPPAINEFEKIGTPVFDKKLLWFRTISPPARILNPQPCASVCVTSPASTKSKTTLKWAKWVSSMHCCLIKALLLPAKSSSVPIPTPAPTVRLTH